MSIMDYYVAAYHDEEFRNRFESYIQLGNPPDVDCWKWTGYIDSNGYGRISLGDRPLLAHRFMYLLVTDHYPLDLDVHHTCSNRRCISPYHLEALTRVEHRFKDRTTHCKRGHERTSDSTYIDKRGYRACKICRRQRNKR